MLGMQAEHANTPKAIGIHDERQFLFERRFVFKLIADLDSIWNTQHGRLRRGPNRRGWFSGSGFGLLAGASWMAGYGNPDIPFRPSIVYADTKRLPSYAGGQVDADCSLGLSMLGVEVEQISEWGPAYFSGHLRPGDKVYTHPCVYIFIYNFTYMNLYICIDTCTYMNICTYVFMYIYILYIYEYMYIYLHVYL